MVQTLLQGGALLASAAPEGFRISWALHTLQCGEPGYTFLPGSAGDWGQAFALGSVGEEKSNSLEGQRLPNSPFPKGP